jgi:hypothetical protein
MPAIATCERPGDKQQDVGVPEQLNTLQSTHAWYGHVTIELPLLSDIIAVTSTSTTTFTSTSTRTDARWRTTTHIRGCVTSLTSQRQSKPPSASCCSVASDTTSSPPFGASSLFTSVWRKPLDLPRAAPRTGEYAMSTSLARLLLKHTSATETATRT